MKIRNLLIIIAFLYLAVCCESPTETFTSADEYYPLEVGNKWYYSFNQSDITVFNEVTEIVGTANINNNTYFVKVTYGLPPNSYSDTSYARIEKSKLYIGQKSNINGIQSFNENLTADFSLSVGDTSRINEYDFFTITKEYDNIIEIKSRNPLLCCTKFQKGIGIIESTVSGFILHRRTLVKTEFK